MIATSLSKKKFEAKFAMSSSTNMKNMQQLAINSVSEVKLR